MYHVVHHVLFPARLPAAPEKSISATLIIQELCGPVIDDDVIGLCKGGLRIGMMGNPCFFGRDTLRIRLPVINIRISKNRVFNTQFRFHLVIQMLTDH